MNSTQAKTWLAKNLQVAKRTKEMSTKPMTITPDIAKAMLEYNTRNRPLNRATVNRYKGLLQNGKWILTSDGISFAQSAFLGDGQHRLQAVVETNIEADFNVTFGETDEAFAVKDTGRRRTPGDTIAILTAEKKDAALIGATLRLLVHIANPGVRIVIENSELSDILAENPEINASIEPGKILGKQLSASGTTAAHYLIARNTNFPHKLEEFWHKLVTGEMMPATDPIMVFRSQFPNYKAKNYPVVNITALIIKCWNAWIRKRTLEKLMFKNAESFPTPL